MKKKEEMVGGNFMQSTDETSFDTQTHDVDAFYPDGVGWRSHLESWK